MEIYLHESKELRAYLNGIGGIVLHQEDQEIIVSLHKAIELALFISANLKTMQEIYEGSVMPRFDSGE